ncbi:MAG TPA: hypothetical protein VFM59_06330, partial [Salinimicrobium sp.]|nr:hypothetical protein [Salinimicrobium sp.]
MKVFLEKQFLKPWWLFMMILAVILVIVGTAYFITINADDDVALIVSIISILIALPIVISIYNLKLETRIDEKGIFTYFSPLGFTKKFIPWEDITECYVRKYSTTDKFGGWGLRGMGSKWREYNVDGNDGIEIKTRKHEKFLVGTLEPEAAEKTISQYHSPP